MNEERFSSFDVHKDESPKKTIEKIANILDLLGFKKEDKRIIHRQAYDNCYSCTLLFSNSPYAKNKLKKEI